MNTAIARLRAKTDRQLAVLIRREFERAQTLAARGRYAEAVQLADQVRALLAVSNLSQEERELIERKLDQPATACA